MTAPLDLDRLEALLAAKQADTSSLWQASIAAQNWRHALDEAAPALLAEVRQLRYALERIRDLTVGDGMTGRIADEALGRNDSGSKP